MVRNLFAVADLRGVDFSGVSRPQTPAAAETSAGNSVLHIVREISAVCPRIGAE